MFCILCCGVQGAGGLWPDSYRLVLQYPRRLLEAAAAGHTSLAEAGFDTSQQAVFVEHIES
jgi:hypothetical protein